MFIKKILLALTLLCFINLSAQDIEFEKTSKSEANALARHHINELKESVLLVRLKADDASIGFLKATGETKEAAKRQEKIDRENKEIIKSFKNRFNFCPVYFFYSYHTVNLKQGYVKGIFLNDELVESEEIVVDLDKGYYTAELGDVYFSTFGTHLAGVKIMDSNFETLKDPFPYYLRQRKGLKILEIPIPTLITKFNERLKLFYLKGS